MNKKQIDSHIFKGMQMDLADSKHPNEYLKYAHNIRITARENDSLLSITNDRDMTIIKQIDGIYLGHCLIRQYLVVFLFNQGDSNILRYDLSKDPVESVLLYSGDLYFNKNYPIECVGSYENDDVIKVYWTDGLNQPRIINIMKSFSNYNDTSFDFVRELRLRETIKVVKDVSSLGNFPSGVIQYAFTYYDRYMQESNVFYTTPLQYISYSNRGASPEDKVNVAFKITIDDIDTNWEYLRVYSILRTSIDATPSVKRVTDIYIKDDANLSVTITDFNTEGNYIDPTELLYKGGQSITAKTICSKDNTLFLGNINLNKKSLNKQLNNTDIASAVFAGTRHIYTKFNPDDDLNYSYFNQLNTYSTLDFDNNVPCGGFKGGNTYRLGVQFQYKDGSWDNPIFIQDFQMPDNFYPDIYKDNDGKYRILYMPNITCTLSSSTVSTAMANGYKRARPVIVSPNYSNRTVLAQGVLNPVLFVGNKPLGTPQKYQSSWFFRPYNASGSSNNVSSPSGYINVSTLSEIKSAAVNGSSIRQIEMFGLYDMSDLVSVLKNPFTFHSPDIEFNDYIKSLNLDSTGIRRRGYISFNSCLSSVNIQTSSPTISNLGGGEYSKEVITTGSGAGIISGLLYDDSVVDDLTDNTFGEFSDHKYSSKWMVYLWHKSGSLNNDVDRSNFTGTRSAVLKKKIVSNLRYADTTFETIGSIWSGDIELFDSNEGNSIKVASSLYNGNVDTVFNPILSPYMFTHNNSHFQSYTSQDWYYTWTHTPEIFGVEITEQPSIVKYDSSDNTWKLESNKVGDKVPDLIRSRGIVRVKYKSTSHLVCDLDASISLDASNSLPVCELCREVTTSSELYGDILSNIWIPCGEPVILSDIGTVSLKYNYGDTYFQRWDCLKTYPYTPEDENQVVEIGSFMLETYINIDGRYDRNRGLVNNTHVSPVNFNLINNVYSQLDNFFNYRILPSDILDDVNDLTKFSNQITWSLQRTNSADIDEWTRMSLASVYDLNGNHGAVNKLCVYKNNIFCFQDRAISNILFNSRVQVPASDGLPIEISNNYKVDGARYITESIGCNNKFTVSVAPSGIYFIDTISNHLYQIGENIMDVSLSKNMTSWFNGKTIDKTLYDTKNNDLYIFSSGVDYSKELCFSDILGEFISEMDIYNYVTFIESYGNNVFAGRDNGGLFLLNTMFTGDYQPWKIEFVSNGNSQGTAGMDKVFTNLEYRMDIYDSDDTLLHDNSFNSIQVWNEYQDTGIVNISYIKDKPSILKKKFRVWRIDIPRSTINKRDRIRNTWCHVKLWSTNYNKAILHDISMIYYV